MPRKSPDLAKLIATDTVAAARALIGAELIRRHGDGRVVRFRICETEAYDGFEDRASHASKAKTARNAPMFGPDGVWYVYLCYGMHEMLNLVTREADYPAAILIRGALELDADARVVRRIDGPGRMTKALGVHRREFNDRPASEVTGLWISPGAGVPDSQVSRTPRVGVAYAGPEWAAMPWRFVWKP
jgi:DNA-3-methyladenine glycosylase